MATNTFARPEIGATAAKGAAELLAAAHVAAKPGGPSAIVGGPGIDTADFSGAPGGVIVGLHNSMATNNGFGVAEVVIDCENVRGSAFDDLIIGADNVNEIWGGDGRDYLIGLGGSDTLHGGFGVANHLQGGFGDDKYYVDALDTITEFAGQGYDQVYASRDRYNLAANLEELIYTGSSAFFGGGNALDNLIQGGAGNDYLNGRGGNDVLRGGDGMDVADYLFAVDEVIVNLAEALATNDGDDGIDSLVSIEGVRGSSHDDLITGSADANLLDGAGGDDTLNGGDGADTLRGAAGEDILIGGLGWDMIVGGDDDDFLSGGEGSANHLQGGRGNDTYVVSANDTLVEFANEGFDRVETTRAAYALKANFEALEFTGAGNFTGGGNDLANRLTGGAGNDTLTGAGGNDMIDGRDGFDTAVLSGTQAQYAILELASGGFRITDSVGGRDGVDTLTGVEQVRFSDGSTLALTPALAPPVAAAPDAKASAPVLPGPPDDAFELPADLEIAGAPLLDLGGRWAGLPDLESRHGTRFPAMADENSPAVPVEDIRGPHDQDDWLF